MPGSSAVPFTGIQVLPPSTVYSSVPSVATRKSILSSSVTGMGVPEGSFTTSPSMAQYSTPSISFTETTFPLVRVAVEPSEKEMVTFPLAGSVFTAVTESFFSRLATVVWIPLTVVLRLSSSAMRLSRLEILLRSSVSSYSLEQPARASASGRANAAKKSLMDFMGKKFKKAGPCGPGQKRLSKTDF